MHMKSTLSAAVSRVCCWSWDRPIHLWTKPLRGKNQVDVQFVNLEINLSLSPRLVPE